MTVSISKIRGMSADVAAKLRERGISNSQQLLEATKTPKDRKELAAAVGVETGIVLEFANRADLARIRGIGEVFSDLLEKAGVDTVKELAIRVPENLHAKLIQINNDMQLSGRKPTHDDVKLWVTQAKELPKILEY